MRVIRGLVPVAAALWLTAVQLCIPLHAQLDGGIPLQFENFEGLFAGRNAITLKLETPDGLQSFRLLKEGETVPVLGKTEGTSILVGGQAKLDFLRRGMTVQFDAEEDNEKKHLVAVENILVLATSGRHDHSRELIAPIDEATGTNLYRWTVQIDSLKSDEKTLHVLLRGSSGLERLAFPVDLEKTVVDYVVPDLSLAKPGDPVEVRALVLPTGSPLAIEVYVDRYPAEPAADAVAAQQGMAPPDGALPPPDDMDVFPDEVMPGEGEVFDFGGANPAPGEVPMLENGDPEFPAGASPAFDWANPPRPLYTFPPPKGDLLRQWYKIN